MIYYGITTLTAGKALIIDDVIIEDSAVGVYAMAYGNKASSHEYMDQTVTIKNSYISGKERSFKMSDSDALHRTIDILFFLKE